MIRSVLFSLAFVLPVSAFAQTSKQESCTHQAAIVEAVKQARLKRVKERNVSSELLSGTPSWPANYNAAIPLIAPWVYEMKQRDVKNKDIAAAWMELCLKQ